MPLLFELDSHGYYFTTMTRADVVLAIRVLTRELDAMEREGTEGRTVYDFHETLKDGQKMKKEGI